RPHLISFLSPYIPATHIYTLSLHDALPIFTWMGSSLSWLAYPNLDLPMTEQVRRNDFEFQLQELKVHVDDPNEMMMVMLAVHAADRKSTRLNSSHRTISYAVFCLKKKTNT